MCAANSDHGHGDRIGRIIYADGSGVPTYLVEDAASGGLALEFEDNVRLPVERKQLSTFMALHGLCLQALSVVVGWESAANERYP